jgi:calcium-dependent protein kinase
MLREADSNGDGKVSRDEFHALFTQSTRPDELGQYDARYAPLESVEA